MPLQYQMANRRAKSFPLCLYIRSEDLSPRADNNGEEASIVLKSRRTNARPNSSINLQVNQLAAPRGQRAREIFAPARASKGTRDDPHDAIFLTRGAAHDVRHCRVIFITTRLKIAENCLRTRQNETTASLAEGPTTRAFDHFQQKLAKNRK